MSMKQQIMEKLFAEQPLTNEEILYIGSNLDETVASSESPTKTRRSKKAKLPFKHEAADFADACGLRDIDFDSVNKIIKSEVMDKKEELSTKSKQVEVYERIALSKPVNMRLILYQFMKMKDALNNRQGIGIKLGGSGKPPGDLGDFLDFLKGLGK